MPLNLQCGLIVPSLLSAALLHCQNLDHADEDVDEVQLE